MAEQTTPVTGVEPAQPSVEERLVSFFARDDKPKRAEQEAPAPKPEVPTEAPAEHEAQPTESQADDELSPDDLISEDERQAAAQPTVEEFELVHNGQQVKLSRDDTIKLAQQGFDYTRKTQAIAAKERQLAEALQTAEEVVKLQAALTDDVAQVKGFERALAPYQNVDWVAIATSDPAEYAKHRAQYDALVQAYNAAVGGLRQKSEAIARGQQNASSALLQTETEKMRELIPAWRDESKFSAESKQVADYGIKEGYSAAEMNSIRDARMVRTLYKAMQYDRLLEGKAERVKQLRSATPMAKPGASTGVNPKADKERELRTKLQRSGRDEDAAALLLNRMR